MDKNVLLFSGGLDSFCLLHSYKFDKILFFILGTEDNYLELKKLKEMGINKLEIIDLRVLKKFELNNKIIPFRNNILVTLASNYGNNIYIGCTLGDTTKDKDYVFKSQMEGMLNYFGQDKNKVNHNYYPYKIIMPYKNMTKTEIVKQYLDNGGSYLNLIKNSRSCYKDGDKECGECRSCIRKAIALINNDISVDEIFTVHPLMNISNENKKKINERGREKKDLKKALQKCK